MAKFSGELPTELIKEFTQLDINLDKMLGEMVEEGARATMDIVKSKVPRGLREAIDDSNITLSKVYKTPSDDGINCQVMITGYFTNRNGEKTPAPLVANMFEYGSSIRTNYPKQPFFRQSFNKQTIEKVMLNVQKKYIQGG